MPIVADAAERFSRRERRPGPVRAAGDRDGHASDHGGPGRGGWSRDRSRAHAPAPTPARRRRGRRPGGADTRAALLDAARAEFAERGYDGATVRVIAERAGVDPAMVNHWFGGKEALFTAALDLPLDPSDADRGPVPGDPDAARRADRATASSPSGTTPAAAALAALVRSVASHDDRGAG